MTDTPDDLMDRFQKAETPEEALAILDRALAIDDGYIPALGSKGTLLGDLGRHDEALACFERILELRPDIGAAHYSRGLQLQEMGQLDEAIDAYSSAIEAEPGSADAYVNRGRLRDDRGDSAGALEDYAIALKLDPNDDVAWSNRGNSLRTLDRPAEALESYERALAIQPGNLPARAGLSTALMMLGRIEEANAARPVDTPLDTGPVIEHRKPLEGGGALVVRYYPGSHQHPDALEQLATDLFGYVAGLENVDAGLEDGVHVQYLWSVLTVRHIGDDRVLCEPSFSINPMRVLDYHVSFSLQTAFMIRVLHDMLQIEPSECTFVDAVVLSASALTEREVVLHRLHETNEEGFSGWVAGPTTVEEARLLAESQQALVVPSAALASLRQAMIKVLSLPAGFRVAFDGHAVTSVKGPDGQERWPDEGAA